MSEFRYNPLLDDYTIFNSNIEYDDEKDNNFCAFCPGSSAVPENYDVYVYENPYSCMHQEPENIKDIKSDIYNIKRPYGKAEIILYSKYHKDSIWNLPIHHVEKIIDLWTDRFKNMRQDKNIKYSMIFQNRGKEVGSTLNHPHGHICGYGYVPLRIKIELENSKKYYQETGEILINKIRDEEMKFVRRVIMKNDSFVVFIPFFSDYPYGVYIVPRDNDIITIEDLNPKQKKDFAMILKQMQGTYDKLFDKFFPYMMAFYQRPFNDERYKDADKYYRFHVKFFPPLRSVDQIKYNAASEVCAMAKTNPLTVENTAIELREALDRYKKEEC